MYSLIVQVHSYLRYFVLFLLLFLIVRTFYYWQKHLIYTKQTDRIGLYLLVVAHTQLILGITLWFISPLVPLSHLSSAMHDKVQRFFTVEHSTMMLIAIVLITIARITSKKIPSDLGKHKRLFYLNFLALVIILAAIPWPFMEGIGAGRHYLFGFF